MESNNKIFMTTDIRYSIIIPHYDIPHLLGRLLNTIPEREDVQVIVVDDRSPECNAYLERYAFLSRSNVEFYITDKNGGGGYARNEGLKHAKGKWILFADADDLFVDGFCDQLDEHYYDEEDIVFFFVNGVYSDNLSRKNLRDDYWNKECQKYLRTSDDKILRYKLVEPWCKMIRREMIAQNNVRFDETRVTNDYFFSVQAGYYAHSVKLSSAVMYVHTQREHSVSSGGWADTTANLRIRLDVVLRVQIFLQERGITLTPMPIRGFMVLALKNCPSLFFGTLYRLRKHNISILSLLWQMLFYAESLWTFIPFKFLKDKKES